MKKKKALWPNNTEENLKSFDGWKMGFDLINVQTKFESKTTQLVEKQGCGPILKNKDHVQNYAIYLSNLWAIWCF